MTYLVGLSKWLQKQGFRGDNQKTTREIELWKAMIANALQGHGT